MITKEQAVNSYHGEIIHANGCTRVVGPRGGSTVKIERYRISGKCLTWKTRPDCFHLPIKYGMYVSSAVDQTNCNQFHLESECPLSDSSLWELESSGNPLGVSGKSYE